MKYDQQVNLICRMAGNIFSGKKNISEAEAVTSALKIYADVKDWVGRRQFNESNVNNTRRENGN